MNNHNATDHLKSYGYSRFSTPISTGKVTSQLNQDLQESFTDNERMVSKIQ